MAPLASRTRILTRPWRRSFSRSDSLAMCMISATIFRLPWKKRDWSRFLTADDVRPRSSSHRDQSGFITLPRDADHSFVEIEILQANITQFGNSQPAGVKKFQHGPVTKTQRISLADAFEQALDRGSIERFG